MDLGIVRHRFGQAKTGDTGAHGHSDTRTQAIGVAEPVADAGVKAIEPIHELADGGTGDGHGFLTGREVAQQRGNPDDGHDYVNLRSNHLDGQEFVRCFLRRLGRARLYEVQRWRESEVERNADVAPH